MRAEPWMDKTPKEFHSEEKAQALSRLRQTIIDHTQGDLFWLGEALLWELEKETGFKG